MLLCSCYKTIRRTLGCLRRSYSRSKMKSFRQKIITKWSPPKFCTTLPLIVATDCCNLVRTRLFMDTSVLLYTTSFAKTDALPTNGNKSIWEFGYLVLTKGSGRMRCWQRQLPIEQRASIVQNFCQILRHLCLTMADYMMCSSSKSKSRGLWSTKWLKSARKWSWWSTNWLRRSLAVLWLQGSSSVVSEKRN